MTSLGFFLLLYITLSVGIGLYASLRIKGSTDFILAGRSLPIYVTIATVFATWFGSEAVMGIPAKFIESGLSGLAADPFGAGMCLVFVGAFFAARLYRMKLLTIGDFYRQKYGRAVEVMVSVFICISYLGWVAAQIVALGLVITIVSGGAVSFVLGMVIGLTAVMAYTVIGGMWAVAYTDFMQMAVILIGLLTVAVLVAMRFDGGAMDVINAANDAGKFEFWPELNAVAIMGFIGTFITLALGSIPQQDVFQRVMSAKDEKTAVIGTIAGGVFYMIFCFVPMFIIYGATLLDPSLITTHMGEDGDSQRILPEFIMGTMPMVVQVLFFGALISAIMSTASGTLLAPSAIIAENILRPAFNITEKGLLLTLRLCVFVFGIFVFGYAFLSASAGLTIFEMVENAYLLPLCGAFVPLAFGVYWSKSNNTGAISSIILGVGTWGTMEILTLQGHEFIMPPQLAGLLMAMVGMIGGSLLSTKR